MSQEISDEMKADDETQQNEVMPHLSVETCANCQTPLTGQYCMNCGQKDMELRKPFWSLVEDTLGDLFSFDSRFFGTMIPLFIRPGYLTREYNNGRRASFVPPFRQYLVITVIFFLLLVSFDVSLFNTDGITINNNTKTTENTQTDGEIITNTEQVDKILDDVVKDMSAGRDKNLEGHSETEKKLYDSSVDIVKSGKEVLNDPQKLNTVLSSWVPKMMFFMLPLFALLLKFTYLFSKKYYIEHLVFSLHYHAFIFLLFIFMLLLYQYMPISRPYLAYLFWYISIYLVIAMYVVYRKGPISTFFRAAFLSFIYLIFMSTALFVTVIYGLTKI